MIQFLNSFQCRIPDQLMNLQSKPDPKVVLQYPFCQLLRIEQTIGCIPRAGSVLAKGWRKQYRVDPLGEIVPTRKLAGKLVVRAVADDEFDLILIGQILQVLGTEAVA